MKSKTMIPTVLTVLLVAGALILCRTKQDPLGGTQHEEDFWLS